MPFVSVLSSDALTSVQLHLADVPAPLLSLLPPGQRALSSFHLTLARLDDQGKALDTPVELPAPAFAVELETAVYLVDSGVKQSCFVKVTPACSTLLRAHLADCGRVLGLSDIDEPARQFHVTLSNRAGGLDVRASVGAVWEHPNQLLGFASC